MKRTFALIGLFSGLVVCAREPLGPSSRTGGLIFSEIHYHPADRADMLDLEFVEIHNTEPVARDLTGYRLSGEIDYAFPAGTTLGPGGFLVVALNPAAVRTVHGLTGVLGPWTGKLDNNTARVRLRNLADAVVLEVEYNDELPWPVAADGTGHSLVLSHPSYGERDARAWSASRVVGGSPGADEPPGPDPEDGLVINEILAHTDLPEVDTIELHNRSTVARDISGYNVTDRNASNVFTFAGGTTLAAGGHVSVTATQLGFGLSAGGETILLWNPAQDQVVDAVRFPAQANGVAWGRWPDGGPDLRELGAHTPSAPNAAPVPPPVVINEIMYRPLGGETDLEYVEIHNRSAAAVDLSHWRFIQGIGFAFPAGTQIQPGGFLVVARNRDRLIADYPQLTAANTFGNFSGRLSNGGERLVLAKPDDPGLPNQDFVTVDEVHYADDANWGRWSDGGGSSLERRDPDADSRRASNWGDSDESGKSTWTTIEHTGLLDNGRSAANELHVLLLGRGECLVDNLEVVRVGQSANQVPNATFEGGMANWLIHGNHIESGHQPTEGDASGASLHLVAQGAGDNGVNRIETDLSSEIASGGQATIRGRARWLRGNPHLLLRLKGNWLEASGRMDVPTNLGSPGLANSIAAAGTGPSVRDLDHAPVLPAANEAVTVTARIDDFDGVAGATLRYRVDPGAALNSVTMVDDGSGADTVAGDGVYAGVIPGQAAGTLVGFEVVADDGVDTTTFPAEHEALVRWGEPSPACNGSGFGIYRMWMSEANINQWGSRQKLSNYVLPCTVVVGDHRVIHGAGARYRGSPFIRPGYNGPLGNLCAYMMRMPKGDFLLGTDRFNLDTLEPGGRDDTHLRERMAFWIAEQIGSTYSHQRFVHIYLNGQKRGEIYADAAQPVADEYLDAWFPGDTDGELFKIDDWFEFNDNNQIGRQFNENARLLNYTTTGGAKKQARYRWSWEKKNNAEPNDDYSGLFSLVDVLRIGDDDEYRDQVFANIDIENWLRTIALRHVVADWDGYGYNRGKNMSMYRPRGGRWHLLQWDLDFALRGSATRGILDANDPTMDRMYAHPTFRRIFLETIADAVNGPMQDAAFAAHMDAWGAALDASCISAGNRGAVKTWNTDRRNYLAGLLPSGVFEITSNGGADFSASGSPVLLAGSAPIGVRSIEVNGVPYPVTWIDAGTWEMPVPLVPGPNHLVLVGHDVNGDPVPGATDSITVTFTGVAVSPVGKVIINEINYHALDADADFVEIHNTSPSLHFDLTDHRLEGVDFDFPPGTVIAPGAFLLVVEDSTAFAIAYGAQPLAGTFAGNLDNGGENLRLVNTNTGETVDEVRYDDTAPWPTAADGGGPSLQLIDSRQDNNRVANWGVSAAAPLWTPGQPNNIAAALPIFPNLRLNEAQPRNLGTIADNAGDFDPWVELVNLGAPTIVSTTSVDLVQRGAVWHYLDDGSDQGSAWRTLDPTAAGWASGPAELGYGDGGEATVVSFGGDPQNKHTTTYYRRDFTVTQIGEITALDLALRRDDGAVVYLNGVEVHRGNMPSGPVNHTTFATTFMGGADETTYFPDSLDPAALVEGLNQLAVEIHQSSLTSSDTSFDLELTAVRATSSSGGDVDLNQLYLTDDLAVATKWRFPAGSLSHDGDFHLVWADAEPGETTAADWHTSFALDPDAGLVALVLSNGANPLVLDVLRYDQIAPDRSFGLLPDGDPTGRTYFYTVTPGAPNNNSAPTNQVLINEWMAINDTAVADPADGKFDDWFELYNPNPVAVELSGYHLSDNPANPDLWTIPNGVVIGPGAHLHVWADGEPDQRDLTGELHADFKLSGGGETIGLYLPDGSPVHQVAFAAQTADITEGSWPDGATNIFVLGLPTPGTTNVLAHPNAPPVVGPVADQTIDEGSLLSFTVPATDANAPPQSLRHSLAPGAPSGLSLDPGTGLLTWGPSELDGPGSYPVTVLVTDDGTFPETGQNSFTIVVREVNEAPVMLVVGPQTVNEHTPLTLQLEASDVDVPSNTLAFGLAPGAPSGLTLSPAGLLEWTPISADIGVHHVEVVVTDNGQPALAATQTIQITVDGVDSPPSLDPVPDQTVPEHQLLTVQMVVHDADLPGETFTWSLVTPPAGAGIDTNGLFAWTPGEPQGPGVHTVTVEVVDGGFPDTARVSFVVHVLEANGPPSLGPLPPRATDELQQLAFTITATDPDVPAETITIQSPDLPAGATLDPGGAFAWTPGETQGPGRFTVTVVAVESTSMLADTGQFTITVNESDLSPVITPHGDVDVFEGQRLLFTNNATDLDVPAETITWSLLAGPPGATIDPDTGVFDWTPGETDGGQSFDVLVQAADAPPTVLRANDFFTINVLESNAPPVLAPIGPQSGNTTNHPAFTAIATDPDMPVQVLTFSLGAGAPAGAAIDPNTGDFTWAPTLAQSPGVHTVNVVVTDGALSDSEAVVITLAEGASPPTLDPVGDRGINEGSLLDFIVTASDPDPGPLTFSLGAGAPAGATIDPATGRFTWTPTEAQGPGVHTVTLIVTDSGAPPQSDSETIRITVNEVNEPPDLADPDPLSGPELTPIGTQLAATDPDLPSNDLAFALGPAPAGVSLSADGLLAWTPTEAQGPTTAVFQVSVSDGAATNTRSVTVEVFEVDAPPVLSAPPIQTINEGSLLDIHLAATDPDLPTQRLDFALAAPPPAGLTLGPSGNLQWTPDETQGPSTQSIAVVVRDTTGLADTAQVLIVVREVDSAPTLGPVANGAIDEGDTFSLTPTATDPDLPAQSFAWRLAAGPATAGIDPATGRITWPTTESDGPGTGRFTVVVHDSTGLADTQSFDVAVAEINQPPVLAPPADSTIVEGELFDLGLVGTDPDLPAQALTYSLTAGPTGSTINAAGRITWPTTEADGPGAAEFSVRLEDDAGAATTVTFIVTVEEQNRPPALSFLPDRSVAEGSELAFRAEGSDPDLPAQLVTYHLGQAPAGASIHLITGVFAWTPGEADGPGTETVSIILRDSEGASVTQSFDITVREINTAPVFDPQPGVTATEGQEVRIQLSATDPDQPANRLVYRLDNDAPDGSVLNPTNGVFTWTPGEADGPGSADIVFRVVDDGAPSLADEITVRVFVLEDNRPPVTESNDITVLEGELIDQVLPASDPDLPAQGLSYALVEGPGNAVLETTTGRFIWQTSDPTNALVRFAVTDVLGASATQAIVVTVIDIGPGDIIIIADLEFDAANGIMKIRWPADIGADYRIQWSTEPDVLPWITLGDIEAQATEEILEDTAPGVRASPNCVYRVIRISP